MTHNILFFNLILNRVVYVLLLFEFSSVFCPNSIYNAFGYIFELTCLYENTHGYLHHGILEVLSHKCLDNCNN